MSGNLLIIDTDPGVDDAFAILMALNRQTRHLANVLAITTVRGNTGIDQACLNTLRVLQVADRLDVREVWRGIPRCHPITYGRNFISRCSVKCAISERAENDVRS